MNSYEIGKVGITLIAIYGIVAASATAIQVVNNALGPLSAISAHLDHAPTAVEILMPVAGGVVVAFVFGVLPAAILVVWREAFAKRWFGSPIQTPLLGGSIQDLFRVALLLLGAATVISGVLNLVDGAATGVILTTVLSEGEAGKPAERGVGRAIGLALRGTTGILVGVALWRYSKRISETLA